MIFFPSSSPSAERLASLQRSVKILVASLSLLLLTGGSRVAAKTVDLSGPQLQSLLEDPSSGLRDFVNLVEQGMITGEMEPVEALVDQEAILARATSGISLPGTRTMRELFSDSTRQNWQQNGITRDFAGTNFRFLRVRSFKGRAGLLFRSAGEKSSLNFFSFVLSQPSPKTFRITDIYTMGLNEYTSEKLHRTYGYLAASLMGEEGRSVTADNGAFVDHLPEVTRISQQLKAGEWREVLESSAALPLVVRNTRPVMLMRLEAAENFSLSSRAEVLEEWLAAWPDEMELPLKLADHYLTQQRWDDAERVVNALLDRTGGDARLMLQRGNIHYQRKHELRQFQTTAKADS